MNLSELMKVENPDDLVYGVVVDCECLSAPSQVSRIGLMFEGGAHGLSERLMDAIITFSLGGAEVILEIPHDAEPEAADLIRLASNAGFSIALLPPPHENGVARWSEMCSQFAEAFLTTPNFSNHIYPVQGFFTYLIAEKLSDMDAIAPTDPYVKARYLSSTPTSWSDTAKEAMRESFRDVCGGEEGIECLAQSLVAAIGHEVSKMAEGDGTTQPNA